MNALDRDRPPELIVAVEGSLAETKRLAERCAALDIPTWIGGQECCSGGGCGPKAALLVQREDLPRISELLRRDWVESIEREHPGMATTMAQRHEALPEGEPPCPACGTAAPLVAGACSDCGLQLE